MELPTVCIVNPKAKSGFTRINESDFDPKAHTIYGEAPAPAAPTNSERTVAKGPKGLWFVMDGEKRVSKGFASEAEAYAAMEA